LNRFAKDIGTLDDQVPSVYYDVLDIGLKFVGIIVIIGCSSVAMLGPAAVLILVFYLIRKFYFYTATSIKRLESVGKFFLLFDRNDMKGDMMIVLNL